MRIFPALFAILIAAETAFAAPLSSTPARMRPYSGIGILMINAETIGASAIYREPGFSKIGELNSSQFPSHEWIFGRTDDTLHLIVMARKGSWLQIAYDDAGREAWINPKRVEDFQAWEIFLKGRSIRLLPALQKRHYQLLPKPAAGTAVPVTHKHLFTVIRIDGDWFQAINKENGLGWLRWRDEDGRLTIRLGKAGE